MAQLTALSKQMEAIQQQQTKMEAIQQQQTKMEAIQQEQTSDNLARSGVSGIYKPHTPAEKGAASDKALSVEEFLTKYGVRRFSESSLACEVCRRHWARPGGSQASQVNATSEKACGYFLQPLGSSGVPHLRQSVSRHQNAVGHKRAIEAKARADAFVLARAGGLSTASEAAACAANEAEALPSAKRQRLAGGAAAQVGCAVGAPAAGAVAGAAGLGRGVVVAHTDGSFEV
jgi:hypothetical protein